MSGNGQSFGDVQCRLQDRADAFDRRMDQLPSRLQRVAMLLATGLNAVDAAQIVGCNRSSISGIRNQLIVDYSLFHDDNSLIRSVSPERGSTSGNRRRRTATYMITLTTRISHTLRHKLHPTDVAEASWWPKRHAANRTVSAIGL